MALTCEKLIDLLVDYIDGELASDTETQLEQHLDACPKCVEFIDSYRQTGPICREALSVEMPDPVKSSLFEFLRTKLHSPST